MIKTAKLFMNGGSQAVRIPKAYRFDADEVAIKPNPYGNGLLILPIKDDRELFQQRLYKIVSQFSDDFFENWRDDEFDQDDDLDDDLSFDAPLEK